jgi:Flp pilus assembly protein TadG
MALILPFLLAFAGGATDLARAYQAWLTIESATRNAAEYVATNSADAATALTDAKQTVCLETQNVPGFRKGPGVGIAAVKACTSPVATIPTGGFVISTTQTGASVANPIVTAHVRVTLPFNTLFPYPFVPHGGWVLTTDTTYAVVRGR